MGRVLQCGIARAAAVALLFACLAHDGTALPLTPLQSVLRNPHHLGDPFWWVCCPSALIACAPVYLLACWRSGTTALDFVFERCRACLLALVFAAPLLHATVPIRPFSCSELHRCSHHVRGRCSARLFSKPFPTRCFVKTPCRATCFTRVLCPVEVLQQSVPGPR